MDRELSRQIEYSSEDECVVLFDFIKKMKSQTFTLLAAHNWQIHLDLIFCFFFVVFSSRGLHSDHQCWFVELCNKYLEYMYASIDHCKYDHRRS
jgi:hypothetical protein